MSEFSKMLIIGCGNMGGAMLHGWLAAEEAPARFVVLDPALDAAPEGVELLRDAPEASDHDCVLLGFKPQQLEALAPQIQHLVGESVTVFSLLAGIELESLAKVFPEASAHMRVMPNLAARLNKSPVVLAASGLDEARRDAAQQLFAKLGSAYWLADETQFDLVTALAGSGPGFVYRFIDALAAAGEELGLPADQAKRMALQMVEGAGALAANSDADPATLADRVASPGGMTREGLDVLDEDRALQELLTRTLKATADKGSELAKLARKDG
jgi:pyrroline-5-carboxylate reductase